MHTVVTIIFLGFLSAYAQRPTDGTLALRQDWGQIPEDLSGYDVFLSVPNCDLIGWDAIMTVDEDVYNGLIYDCAGAGEEVGHNWMIENRIAAEVDYYFWIEHPELVGTLVEVEIIAYKEQ